MYYEYADRTPKEILKEIYDDLHQFLYLSDECTFDQLHNYLLGLTVKWELRKDMLELVQEFENNQEVFNGSK